MNYEVISTFKVMINGEDAEDVKDKMMSIFCDMLKVVPHNDDPKDNSMHIRIESVNIKIDKPVDSMDDRTYTRWTRVAHYDPDTNEVTVEPFKATK